MKTLVQIKREGKFFVAVDLNTNGADQGSTEEEAVSNLKKGLEEHYRVLLELEPSQGEDQARMQREIMKHENRVHKSRKGKIYNIEPT